MRKKLKVLCACAKGLNRSPYMARYLKRKGYSTRYGGVENAPGVKSRRKPKLIIKEDVEWADIIVIVRKRLVSLFKRKFRPKGKKVIVLDVTDSKRLIPKEFARLRLIHFKEFDKKWTYPQLRKAIKPYLPLKKLAGLEALRKK
jgi:predicted protein tyrosine phosphatase